MTRTRRVRTFGLLALAGLSALGALQAFALPRYSARYEQNCSLCHVNPSGGGMRTGYASQELVPKEFAWSPATPAMLADIDPKIGKRLAIGTDFREIYYAADPSAGCIREQSQAGVSRDQHFVQFSSDWPEPKAAFAGSCFSAAGRRPARRTAPARTRERS